MTYFVEPENSAEALLFVVVWIFSVVLVIGGLTTLFMLLIYAISELN